MLFSLFSRLLLARVSAFRFQQEEREVPCPSVTISHLGSANSQIMTPLSGLTQGSTQCFLAALTLVSTVPIGMEDACLSLNSKFLLISKQLLMSLTLQMMMLRRGSSLSCSENLRLPLLLMGLHPLLCHEVRLLMCLDLRPIY